jgi:hypothetical protein
MADIDVTIVTALLGSLVLLGAFNLATGDSIYYCEYRDLVMQCDSISGTFKTCYNSEIGNKRCIKSPYWQKVNNTEQTLYENHTFVVKYEYLYNNKTIEVINYNLVNQSYNSPVYENITEEIICNPLNETCFDCSIQNATQTDCKNYTRQIISGYETKYHLVNQSYIDYEEVVDNTSWRGIKVGDEEILCPFTNCCYVYNNTLSTLTIPPGDRNWEEYPKCRDFELDKNTCYFTDILTGDESE